MGQRARVTSTLMALTVLPGVSSCTGVGSENADCQLRLKSSVATVSPGQQVVLSSDDKGCYEKAGSPKLSLIVYGGPDQDRIATVALPGGGAPPFQLTYTVPAEAAPGESLVVDGFPCNDTDSCPGLMFPVTVTGNISAGSVAIR